MVLSRSLRQWWTQTNDQLLLEAQETILNTLVRTPAASTQKIHGLNLVEFHPQRQHRSDTATVILLHGYGSGLGFFCRAIDPLLESGKVRRILLVDWLGMGRSDRPDCPQPGSIGGSSRCSPLQAVEFFTRPLDRVLAEVVGPDEPVWAVGHSLGGYLLARYVMAASQSVARLNLKKVVLASPVGFPAKPDLDGSEQAIPRAFRVVEALWNRNVTPQQCVRLMGASYGRSAVSRALSNEIPNLDEVHHRLLADYLFHMAAADPSGEFAVNSLLEPGLLSHDASAEVEFATNSSLLEQGLSPNRVAEVEFSLHSLLDQGLSPDVAGVFAREPLEPLFQQIPHHEQPSLKWKVLFGDNDWVRRSSEASARQAMQHVVNGAIAVVPRAGHHLYLDNTSSFVHHILH